MHYSLILLCLFSVSLGAQPNLRTHYSINAPFDSVKSLHISKVTTTSEYCKDTSTNRYESITTETFDREGNQLTQDHLYPGNGYSGPEIIIHHFTYDTKGRIVVDSTRYRDVNRVTKYKYADDNHHLTIRQPPEFIDSSEIVYITYHDDVIDSAFGVDRHGDTVYAYRTNQFGSTEITWRRDSTGKLIIVEQESNVVSQTWTSYLRFCESCDQYRNQEERIIFDSKGNMSSRTVKTNFKLSDYYDYKYDDNNRLVKSTWTDYSDPASGMQTEIFIYNKTGQLVEKINSYSRSATIVHIYYSYNEKGLLTQMTEDSGNGYAKCVRWEYEYW